MPTPMPVAKRFTSAVIRATAHLTLRAWIFLAAPMAVMTSFMISFGTQLQTAVFSAIGQQAPNIYAAAYGEALTTFPSLLDWLAAGLYWPYLLAAGAIVFFATRVQRLKYFLPVFGLYTALALMVLDLVGAATTRDFNLTKQIANVTANLLGGAAVAALCGLGLLLYRAVVGMLCEFRLVALMTGFGALTLVGVSVSAMAWLSLRLIYDPLPARISIELAPPATGYFSAARRERAYLDAGQLPSNPFLFLPRGGTTGAASIEYAQGPIRTEWQRATSTHPFNVDIRFLGDCLFTRISNISPAPAAISRRDVRHVVIELDNGAGDLQVASEPQRIFDFHQANLNSYRLEVQNQLADITYFTEPSDRLTIKDREGVTFLLGAHLTVHNQNVFSRRARTMSIDIDGRRWVVALSTDGAWRANNFRRCHDLPLGALPADEGRVAVAEQPAVLASALVRITPGAADENVYVNPENSFSITRSNGWMAVSDIPLESLRRLPAGYLSALISHGNTSDFRSDNVAVEMRPYDAAVLLGDFSASFTEAGHVHVGGIAGAAWRNNERLNHTHWENLPSEWKISLIAAFLAAAGFLIKWGFSGIAANKDRELSTFVKD